MDKTRPEAECFSSLGRMPLTKLKWMKIGCGLLAMLVPFLLFWTTRSTSLGFADAGEFALVSKIAGIAHPPGFPSYVIFGWAWGKLLSLVSASHVVNMVLFSIVCVSTASLLLFLTLCRILESIYVTRQALSVPVALIASLSFCTGLTVWHWANSVEVYGFHILAMATLMYGLATFAATGRFAWLLFASAGLAAGLANHHLTMIMFLPFIPFLFRKNTFWAGQAATGKKRSAQKAVTDRFVDTLRSRPFLLFSGIAALLTLLFYAWLYIRAGQEISFKFGSPDSASRWFYHVSGGAWQKNTAKTVEGLPALRFPYFSGLAWNHLFLFLPFFFIGIAADWKQKRRTLAVIVLIYFSIVFMYQLRIDQTADTDAYMLLPFFMMSFPVATGLMAVAARYRLAQFCIPLLLAAQIFLHYPRSQKKDFDVSESIMAQLSRSAPAGSVLLISDWTMVSQYYYYRIAEGFRTDLVLLNYDLKFTHWKIFPTLYPRLYASVKTSYDRFIAVLGAAHPQEIYNTGCTLDSRELMNAYLGTVADIQAYCKKNNVAFLVDPKAYLFLAQYNLMSNTPYMSGFLVSSLPLETGREFLSLPFRWLNSPLLLTEPAATDKIVDFEAALDFSRNYYRQVGDTAAAARAETSYQRIKALQRKMKKNMPFVYRAG